MSGGKKPKGNSQSVMIMGIGSILVSVLGSPVILCCGCFAIPLPLISCILGGIATFQGKGCLDKIKRGKLSKQGKNEFQTGMIWRHCRAGAGADCLELVELH